MKMNAGSPLDLIGLSSVPLRPRIRVFGYNVPHQITLPIRGSPGFFFGLPSAPSPNYVGMPQGSEEHITVIGGSGSGKSSGIAKPTLRTWGGAICATDIKGELSECYEELYQTGLVSRPYIIFDPMDAESPSYDPFDGLLQGDETHLVSNIWDIVVAILPTLPNDNQPFWAESEQGVFAAVLLHCFKCGLSFSETVTAIVAGKLSTLCEDLLKSPDVRIRFFLGEAASMKPETLANIDRGLRNKLMLFATDPFISHAFRGRRENAVCFSWEDLDKYNIFLRIPGDKIEEWGGAVNLMYTQLIRHLERRPEMHSEEGKNNVQTLLLMDEFARFGKLEIITAAMATLRSKNVNICLMIQSVAQLDRIYGEKERRVIFDNCGYLAILRATDPDTQKYLCEMIGTHESIKRSVSENFDEEGNITGYSKQTSQERNLLVQPHELRTLNGVLLLTPHGFHSAEKFRMDNEEMWHRLFSTSVRIEEPLFRDAYFETLVAEYRFLHPQRIDVYPKPEVAACPTPEATSCLTKISANQPKRNEGAKMMSIDERSANANKRIEAAELQERIEQDPHEDEPHEEKPNVEEPHEGEIQEDEVSYRHRIIGELVTRYFPTVRGCKLGTDDEDRIRLETFLFVLSVDPDLVDKLQEQADQLVSEEPDGGWREPG